MVNLRGKHTWIGWRPSWSDLGIEIGQRFIPTHTPNYTGKRPQTLWGVNVPETSNSSNSRTFHIDLSGGPHKIFIQELPMSIPRGTLIRAPMQSICKIFMLMQGPLENDFKTKNKIFTQRPVRDHAGTLGDFTRSSSRAAKHFVRDWAIENAHGHVTRAILCKNLLGQKPHPRS